MDLVSDLGALRRLTRTDADPRVRHRADGLLLVTNGLSLAEAAHRLGFSRNSLRTWRKRFLAEGRDGLTDRERPGCSPKRYAARDLLETALEASPLDYDYPVTT